ncbi:hypothetical protein ARTHROSP310_35490 [Arthrobacter sp. AD-310]
MPTPRHGALAVVVLLALALAGCEYTGPEEAPPPSPAAAATPEPRPFETSTTDAELSELEEFSDWSAAQLKPRIQGEVFGSRSSNTTTGDTLMVGPGRYDFQFVCSEAPWAEVSLATAAGVEVLAPVQIQCGEPITTPITLPGQGADITMSPVFGPEGRFAYRLIPATPPGPPAGTTAPPG